ncbi:MAG: NAD(P) transhydrogenase subunit alpha [Acidimicrobiaceae bacterium]|nr:NAD(P) transhydrogenase subunit alpha [Acidimicrobiaceae bacterium]MYH94131.1 NAD(P) transhydrogenase subunit alpha [Acidimicrobiaceae bacterium]
MRLGLLRESAPSERRVALVPDGVGTLTGHGCDLLVERGAGSGAGIDDAAYQDAGASVVDYDEVCTADLVVSVRDLADRDAAGSPPKFVGVFDPLWVPQKAQRHADEGRCAFSLDLVPRITRAQTMDVLSSMGTIAGYEAVLLAASRLPQMFPLMMTAAGTLAPARVLVLGAGVAGLQAIATARRLGAVVEGYDVRPAAVEQIRSMGARAVELDLSEPGADAASVEDSGGYARAQSEDVAGRQQELLAPYVAASDVVITTAAIPGRASPLLLTAEMVDAMALGSVVIDLASERGGNCAASQSDVEVERGGVTVLAPTDLVSRCARHASQMFSRNLVAFLRHLAPDGEIDLRDDEILEAMLVTRDGAVVHPGVAEALGGSEATGEG